MLPTALSGAGVDTAGNEFSENADNVGLTYNEEDEDSWTTVGRGKKSRPVENVSRRPIHAGLFGTPAPSDIKLKMQIGELHFYVYAPLKTTTDEIRRKALKESLTGDILPDRKHIRMIQSSFD